MSKYTQKQETEIVRDAMTLTTAIQIGEEELSKQKSKQFKQKPAAPFHKILDIPKIQPQIPEAPKTKYSYSEHLKTFIKGKNKFIAIGVIAALFLLLCISMGVVGLSMFIMLAMIAVPVLLVIAFLDYQKKKKELNQQLAQSPEYLKSVEEAKRFAEENQQKAKEEIAQKQAEIDAKYKSDLEHYNNVILPEYNREYDAWKITQKLKIEMLEEELQLNKETLDALYTSTNIISNRYRTLGILKWLYDELSSSDITFERAIDLYNAQSLEDQVKGMGGQIAAAINDMHSSMISGFNSVYEAVEAGNEELAKTRRDQNLANTAGIIQRHNLNKMVKNQNGMLDKYFNQ